MSSRLGYGSEIADSFDEEMEIDESRLEVMLADMEKHPEREGLERRRYFRELFRLQHELVRLQDRVVHKGLKVVAIFAPTALPSDNRPRLMGGSR